MMEKTSFRKLSIPNAEQNKFRQELKKIKHGEYEVEQLNDGKKIIISKPGRKGNNDFRVDLYDPKDGTRKTLSHSEIIDEDIELKYNENPEKTIELIYCLLDVCKGEEPDKVIKDKKIEFGIGLPVDTMLKIYKWIWGQEDCNYEYGKGRWMSMESILENYGVEIE
jgi:hypothetical protein